MVPIMNKNKTLYLYEKVSKDRHRLETFLTVLKGYLNGAYSVCASIENNKQLFPNWNESVTTYILASLDLIADMESYYK